MYTAAISGFLATAFGAFGAHGLKHILTPERFKVFETANFYHFIHTLLLLALVLIQKHHEHKLFRLSGAFVCAGLILFSGSLYLFSVTGIKTFAHFAPFGGLSFMLAWLMLLLAAIKSTNK